MSTNKGKWTKVGEIQKSENGKLKIKVQYDTTLKEGTWLQLIDPRASLKNLLTTGKITEEKYEERMSKMKDWYKYDVFLVE